MYIKNMTIYTKTTKSNNGLDLVFVSIQSFYIIYKKAVTILVILNYLEQPKGFSIRQTFNFDFLLVE